MEFEDEEGLLEENPLNPRQESLIKQYARAARKINDILFEDGLLTELRALYTFTTIVKSAHMKRLIREGCFNDEEKTTWSLSEEYKGVKLSDVFPEEQRAFVSSLRDKRAKLVRTVREILGRLAKEVFFDQAAILEAEAKKAASSTKKKPRSVEPSPSHIQEAASQQDDMSILTESIAEFAGPVVRRMFVEEIREEEEEGEGEEYVGGDGEEEEDVISENDTYSEGDCISIGTSTGVLSIRKFYHKGKLYVKSEPGSQVFDGELFLADGTLKCVGEWDAEKSRIRKAKKYRNVENAGDTQQLYETHRDDVLDIVEYLRRTVPQLQRVFEPCYGNGAIGKVMEEYGYEVTVKRDLYTLPEHHDFLTADFPPPEDYDIIVTNTPFYRKGLFLARLFETGKPFCAIFPMGVVSVHQPTHGLKFLVPSKLMKFCHNGHWSAYSASCHWFLGNFQEEGLNTVGSFSFEYI